MSQQVIESAASRGISDERETLRGILKSKIEIRSLSDIRSHRRWDFSWATLTKPHRFTARNTYTSDASFMASLKAHNKGLTYSLLCAVGAFDENNTVVLYGGALVDIVLKRESFIKDWDLRLIGSQFTNSEENCVDAAKKFVDNVFLWIGKQNEEIQLRNIQRKRQNSNADEEELLDINAVKVARKRSTITFVIPATRQIQQTVLQFTFAPYASIEDLFQNSNPHCTRIAIVNGGIQLDELARYCLESLCVVLDTKSLTHCRNGSHGDTEADHFATLLASEVMRMIKYFDKGFDIILPDLDMSKLPRRNLKYNVVEVLDLPLLTVIYDKVENNKIFVRELKIPDDANQELNNAGSNGYDEEINMNSGTAIHHNICCVQANVYDKFMFVTEGEMVSPIFDFCPTITPRMVDKAYETVKVHLSSGEINVNEIIRYFSQTPPADVLERLINERLRNLTKTQDLPALFQLNEEDLDDIIATEVHAVLAKMESTREVMTKKGLNKLVFNFPTKVSPESAIANAIYGNYLATSES